jgi:heme exporter protein B
MTYFSDVGALLRKDLTIELRAKETVPAMLLFVISALTIFHFAVPAKASPQVSLGLLWVAIVFTALLGLTRAFVPEREQGVFDALVLAPSDRSAIWAAKSISCSRSSAWRSSWRSLRSACSSTASTGGRWSRSPSPTSGSAPSGR